MRRGDEPDAPYITPDNRRLGQLAWLLRAATLTDVERGNDRVNPDNAIWFAIADVCGKGVVAATKTSMIKYSVRSLVRPGLGPAAILGEVNRMVSETGESSDIVTLWLGRYEPGFAENDNQVVCWRSEVAQS